MQAKDNLTKQFNDANLPLELLGRPFANRDENIFQMDIVRRARAEIFRLFPGHETNQVLVQGKEPQIRQLVLYVREPKRFFEVEHRINLATKDRAIKAIKERNGRILRVTQDLVVEQQSTPDNKRHYLVGHDEAHLFIAQLPAGVSTVRRAHEVLRAPEARGRDARRQGEWFFIDISTDERKIVEHLASQSRVQKDAGIGGNFRNSSFGRRPRKVRQLLSAHEHVAEELLAVPLGEGRNRSYTIYVRGKVRHVDHKTITLRDWKRVALNNEEAQRTGTRARGINWID